jgi:hypothetical protein
MGRLEELVNEWLTVNEALQTIWDEVTALNRVKRTDEVVARKLELAGHAVEKGAELDAIQALIDAL